MQDRPAASKRVGGLSEYHRTLIMGVLNVTPDSFSDGGRFFTAEKAVDHALQLIEEGADIIDVGGESTRPGSWAVSEQEELDRVLPVIEELVSRQEVVLSIDTRKPKVASHCLRAGTRILNDVTGLRDDQMLEAASEHGAAVVIMHMKGEPRTMQQNPVYGDVVAEIREFLEHQVERARQAGLGEIIVDPGIGFGKTAAHNFEILKRLNEFQSLGCPILVGPSRKSFLATLPGCTPVEERLEGTLAAVCVSVLNGANIVRVHDVKECKRVIDFVEAVRAV